MDPPRSAPSDPGSPRPRSDAARPSLGIRVPSLRRSLLLGAPAVLVAVVLMQVLSGSSFARGIEAAFLRVARRVNRDRPQAARRIVLVTIDEADFLDPARFGGTTPLAVGALSELIEAVTQGRPAVVAVALDTSARTFRTLAPPVNVPVFWAQDAEPGGRTAPVLGRGAGEAPPASGVWAEVREVDGLVWRVRRRFESVSRDALAWTVVKAYCKGRESTECRARNIDANKDLFLDFSRSRRFTRLSAGELLRAAQTPPGQEDGPLAGKIVIVGPAYAWASDEVTTPAGTVPSAQLLAEAIETEIEGGGVRTASRGIVVAVELVLGLLVVAVFHALTLEGAAVLAFGAAPPVLGCLWAFDHAFV